MTRCPDCDALRLSLGRVEGQLASADRSWIEMRDDLDRAIDARDAAHRAHRDAQSQLEEVAAKRDAAVEEAAKWRHAGSDGIDRMAEHLGRAQSDVAARDRALDACAERIAELLKALTVTADGIQETRLSIPACSARTRLKHMEGVIRVLVNTKMEG